MITRHHLIAALVVPAAGLLPATSHAEVAGRAVFSLQESVGGEYLQRDEKDLLIQATKAKLAIEAEPHASTRFGASVIAKHYGGETAIPAGSYLPDDLFATLLGPDAAAGTPGTAEALTYQYSNTLYLQEAYGEYRASGVQLRIGRQVYLAGVGQALRPTDLFNINNPADPMWEPEGHDGLRLTADLPLGTRFDGFLELGPRLARSNWTANLAVLRSGLRAVASITRHWRSRTDWQALNTPAGLGQYTASGGMDDLARMFRWDLVATELSAAIGRRTSVRTEAGYAFVQTPAEPGSLAAAGADHLRLMLGADHRFDAGLGILLEYMYLGEARSRAADLDLNDRLALLSGEVQASARHSGFFTLSQALPGRLTAGLRGQVAAVAPANAVVNPFVTWQPNPWVTADLFGLIPLGSTRGAFGNVGPGIYLWIKFELAVDPALARSSSQQNPGEPQGELR
jgi:hypothetical protein